MIFLVLLVFLGWAGMTDARAYDFDQGQKSWPKWQACSADAECIAIHDACSGWTAVNGQYAKEAQEYQDELATAVKCLDTKLSPEPKVLCIDQICAVKPAGLPD